MEKRSAWRTLHYVSVNAISIDPMNRVPAILNSIQVANAPSYMSNDPILQGAQDCRSRKERMYSKQVPNLINGRRRMRAREIRTRDTCTRTNLSFISGGLPMADYSNVTLNTYIERQCHYFRTNWSLFAIASPPSAIFILALTLSIQIQKNPAICLTEAFSTLRKGRHCPKPPQTPTPPTNSKPSVTLLASTRSHQTQATRNARQKIKVHTNASSMPKRKLAYNTTSLPQ